MRLSLPISIVAHVLVGASGMFFWTGATTRPIENVVNIRLDGVSLGEETNLSEINRPEPVPEETPEPEPVEEEIAEEEGETPPDAASPDERLEDPESIPTLTDEAEPEATPEPEEEDVEEPDPEPIQAPNVQKRQEKKEQSLDDLFAANEDILRDYNQDRGSKRATPTRELKDQEERAPRNAAGDREGDTAAISDFIRAQINANNCWRSVKDLPDWERLDVTINFRLDQDGKLSRAPKRIRPSYISPTDKFMLVASDRAIRAINLCEPFDLPPEKYDLWKNEDINLTFDEQF